MESNGDIVINILPTVADYRRALFRQSRKILLLSLPLIVMFGISAPLLLIYLFSSGNASKKLPALLVLGVPFLFVFLLPSMILYNIWKQSRHLGQIAEPSEVVFARDSLTVTSPSSSAQTLYSRYVKVVETDSDFIFFPQNQLFVPFAKRFFNADSDLHEVRTRLVLSLGDKAKVLRG